MPIIILNRLDNYRNNANFKVCNHSQSVSVKINLIFYIEMYYCHYFYFKTIIYTVL